MDNKDFLMHYGKVGMRWGHRNKKTEVALSKKEKNKYVYKNFKRYLNTPIKKLTSKEKKIGYDFAISTLIFIGGIAVSRYLASNKGQTMLMRLLIK